MRFLILFYLLLWPMLYHTWYRVGYNNILEEIVILHGWGITGRRFDDDSDEPDWRKAIIVLSREYPISTLDEETRL
ncbi:hypothetical protein COOONC_15289 [Cooperia oncophora]